MRIFVIPSWYPSHSNPIYGTFTAEQIDLLAAHHSNWKFGISIWGQGESEYLLYAKQPFLSLKKWIYSNRKHYQVKLRDNLTLYKTPAFTWTNKVAKGNLINRYKANLRNLEAFFYEYDKPDIILVQGGWPAATFAFCIWQKFEIPYVITERMSPFPFTELLTKNGKLKETFSRAYEHASAIVATSTSVCSRMTQFGIEAKIIHNPVNIDLYYPAEFQVPTNKCIAIGRLVQQKGFDILLTAFSKLKDQTWELTIVGDGEEMFSLKKLASELGIARQIIFKGWVSREDLPKLIREHGSLILSSRHETFGNVLVEASASGLPVVATRCGGPEDIVDENTGILCEPNNPKELAEAIKKLWDKTWNKQVLVDHTIKYFSPESFVSKMEKLIKEIIYKKTIDP